MWECCKCSYESVKEQNSLSTFVVRVGKSKNCEQKWAFCFVLVRKKVVGWMRIKTWSDDFNVGWKVSTDQLRHRRIAQKRSVSMLAAAKNVFNAQNKEIITKDVKCSSLNCKTSETAVWRRNISEAAVKLAGMTLAGIKLTLAQSSTWRHFTLLRSSSEKKTRRFFNMTSGLKPERLALRACRLILLS